MHIQPHSQVHNKGGGEKGEGRHPLPFLKIESVLIFERKAQIVSIFGLNFSVYNIVLRVSRRKTSKMLPCRASFSGVFDRIFILKCPSSTNLLHPPPLCTKKFLVAHLHSDIIYFAKHSILNV